jgi:uncharacterized membrane protein
MSDQPSQTVVENVEQVIRDERTIAEGRSLAVRIGEVVGASAGTLTYVFVQIAWVIIWVVINAGYFPGIAPFDPYPFALLGGIMSLQCVFLACFVLMKQAHEARMSDRRSHLALQVNLLVEKEVTKLIQMLERMSVAEGIEEQVTDREAKELGRATDMDEVVQELDRRLDEKDEKER